ATPLELAADLERWLADEPVTAYREPAPARARRWMRRHGRLVSAAAAILLTSVAALSVTALLLRGERDRTEAARPEALANAAAAREQAELARANEARAREQQRRAEANFAKVRAAADQFWLTRLVDHLSAVSQLDPQELLGRLMDDALRFYQVLLGDT